MQNKNSFVNALQSSTGIALSTLMLFAFAAPARSAGPILNGSFENIGTATASFSIDNPTGLPNWSASPSGNKILDCLVLSSAITDFCGNAFGGGLHFWVNPGPSPDGGNFVAIDGVQAYSTPLVQTLTGLVVGSRYQVFFYQAAAQQSGFDGATTDQWQVSLGTDTQYSTLMNNVTHGAVPWMSQALFFTATAASEALSFMAIGTPAGMPPFALLDGVSVTQTPEPGTCMLLGLGLLGIPIARKVLKKRVG